jgi:para-nitrobenzyl esterase
MRTLVFACAVAALVPATAFAQATPAPAAPAPAAPAHYTTADTEIGTLLDDPAAKAILEKNIPGMTTNDQIDMARSMTMKGIQQYSPDQITDAKLAAIDAEFAKLPVKK